MKMAMHTLVLLVLAATILAMTVGISAIIFGLSEEGSDLACATSVRARSLSMAFDADHPTDLRGCETRYRSFDADDSEAKVRRQLVTDMSWCWMSFGGDQRLLAEEDTVCHVCALYDKEGGGNVSGVVDAFEKATGGTLTLGEPGPAGEDVALGDWVEEHTAEAPDIDLTLSLEEELAIIFVQSRSDDGFLVRLLGGGVGDDAQTVLSILAIADITVTGIAVATAVVSGGTSTIAILGVKAAITSVGKRVVAKQAAMRFLRNSLSVVVPGSGRQKVLVSSLLLGSFVEGSADRSSAIVIRPWNERTVRELGCTRNAPQ